MNLSILTSSAFAASGDDNLLRNSLLAREWLAERDEVLKHKWYESERAGRDVGMDRARVSWVIHHRARWVKERRSQES